MNERSIRVGILADSPYIRPLLIGVLLAVGTVARADELGTRPLSWEPRVPIGKCLSPAGRLLVNERPGQPWQSLSEKDDIHSRDLLLALPGTQAVLETRPRSVELTLWGNLPELTQFAGLRSAVILHDSRAFDLDFTLRIGRVILTNRKEKGSVQVWVRMAGAAFRLTLNEPGDAVCLGLYSFWPRGVPFTAAPKPQDMPARTMTFLVLKGQIDVKAGGTQHSLSAPPGPAYFHWDSDNGADEGATRRERVPEWADPLAKAPAKAAAVLEAIEKYQTLAKDREPRNALDELLGAAKKERKSERAQAMAEFAVFGLAAINDMDRVLQALNDPKLSSARQTAVEALRHWIGDAAGRDQRLFQFLLDGSGFSKAQATTVLQLLHDAFAPDDPDTYETLIAYLRHQNRGVRELAWQHLRRLVPQASTIPYDAAGSEDERAKAYASWKQLVPSGRLPTKQKPKKE